MKQKSPKLNLKWRMKLTLLDSMLLPFILGGSLYFVSYVGSMMAFYPLSLINSFINSPNVPSAERIVLAKQALKDKSSQLLDKGRDTYNKNREFLMLKQ